MAYPILLLFYFVMVATVLNFCLLPSRQAHSEKESTLKNKEFASKSKLFRLGEDPSSEGR